MHPAITLLLLSLYLAENLVATVSEFASGSNLNVADYRSGKITCSLGTPIIMTAKVYYVSR